MKHLLHIDIYHTYVKYMIFLPNTHTTITMYDQIHGTKFFVSYTLAMRKTGHRNIKNV